MRLPTWLWPLMWGLRRGAGVLQRVLPGPGRSRALAGVDSGPLDFTDHTPLPQPDHSSCGSSVLVMMHLLADPAFAAGLLESPDPVRAFAAEALATRRRTNSWRDRFGHPQLAWPESLGTRPAALIRELGGRWSNRVIDPSDRATSYELLVGLRGPIPMFIGDGSWMQHIVLVTEATPATLTIYDPACGHRVIRTRAQFEAGRLDVAGWAQPWLLILPR